MAKKRFLPTFFGQLPTFKIKNGQQFLPNLLGFLGVVAKNPLFSLINCEEKIYIFIIIRQKKWANGQKHKNEDFKEAIVYDKLEKENDAFLQLFDDENL